MRLSLGLLLLAALAAPALAQVPPAPPAPPTTPAVVPTPAELAEKRAPVRTQDGEAGLPAIKPLPREMPRPDNDQLNLDVTRYVVDEDAPAALRAALPGLTAAYTGKARSYEDLVNATSAVTRFLQSELDYYLGYAYLPQQTPEGGVVRIAILEGRLDRAVLKGGDDLPVRREVLQAFLDRLKPGSVIKVQDVERTVFLLNDLRGVSVRAEVKPGSQPGTAILEFTPTADARWDLKFDGDANGSEYIGRFRLGATGYWNSPLGRGDSVSASVLASTGGGLRFGLLGYNTPLGSSGLKVGVSVSMLKYSLDEADFPLGLYGDGRTVNVFALYPWVRSRNLNLFSLTAVNDKDYSDTIASIVTDKRVRDAVLGLTGDFRDSLLGGAVNTFDVSYSRGKLSFAKGAPGGLDDDLSYGKLNYSYTRLQNVIDGRLLAYFNLRGQLSQHNLDSTEQFRAGGPDGLRGFASGDGTGDIGILASLELRWLPPEAWFGRFAREIVLAAFVDAAQITFRKDPGRITRNDSYDNSTRLADAGLSLVWAKPAAYALRLSVATPVGDARTSGNAETKAKKTQVYLQGTWFY